MQFSHEISIKFRRKVPTFIILFYGWFVPVLDVFVNESFVLCFSFSFHIKWRLPEISLIDKPAVNCLQKILHVLLRLLHFRFNFLIGLTHGNFLCANLLKLLGFDFVSFGQICSLRDKRCGSILGYLLWRCG